MYIYVYKYTNIETYKTRSVYIITNTQYTSKNNTNAK